jgi:catechol 2,3-dioxygenase-like lactoylglutathione lyase family enzyme
MTLFPDRNRLARWVHWLTIGIALWMVLIAGTALAAGREVRAIALTVSDLDAAVTFYERALGFTKVGERTVADREHDYLTGVFGTRVRTATLALGDETIELDQYLSPAGRPVPVDSRSNDLWFQHFAIVVADMEKAYAHLSRFGVQSISSAPQTIPEWNKAAAGIKAYKFRDPDGHPLELLWFPKGKGNARWHAPGERLFLGIDHTAITVADTERSARFWSELLGLNVLGGSLNSGETQEQLDSAFGAVVRVTGLRPNSARGPRRGVPPVPHARRRARLSARHPPERSGARAHRARSGRSGRARREARAREGALRVPPRRFGQGLALGTAAHGERPRRPRGAAGAAVAIRSTTEAQRHRETRRRVNHQGTKAQREPDQVRVRIWCPGGSLR